MAENGAVPVERLVDDYMAGVPIPKLRERYGLPLGELYKAIRESGRVPTREGTRTEQSTMADLIIATLRETVVELTKRNSELRRENDALKRSAAVRSRSERKLG